MQRLKPYLWLPITAAFLAFAVYRIFESGPAMTCFWGLAMAGVLFWMRLKHAAFYGMTEIIAGLFILWNNYPRAEARLAEPLTKLSRRFKETS